MMNSQSVRRRACAPTGRADLAPSAYQRAFSAMQDTHRQLKEDTISLAEVRQDADLARRLAALQGKASNPLHEAKVHLFEARLALRELLLQKDRGEFLALREFRGLPPTAAARRAANQRAKVILSRTPQNDDILHSAEVRNFEFCSKLYTAYDELDLGRRLAALLESRV